MPTERGACLEAIKAVNHHGREVVRMQKTQKFAAQLDTWRDMVARGLEPTLERMELLWLHDLDDDDALRLLCSYADEDVDGPREALLARLEGVRDIRTYKAAMGTPLWDHHLASEQTCVSGSSFFFLALPSFFAWGLLLAAAFE